jgi:iron complex transport system substrate-binding protein
MKKLLILLLPLLLLGGLLAACGGDDDDVGGKTGETTTTAKDDADGPDAARDRIVSLSPSATESLFAIGAGEQVVAVDLNSNFPEEVPKGTLDAYNPNVEAIAALDPDLVVIADDANGLTEDLDKLGIPVLLQAAPAKLSEVYTQIKTLGTETGHEREANDLAAGMRKEIADLKRQAPRDKVTYYYELDNTFFTVAGDTFIGKLLRLARLTNIADAAGQTTTYPQLSSEFIVQQDPRLILLADTKCCQQNAAAVAARPGWGGLTAVKAGGVIELDDDIASRWGPRVVDLLRTAVKAAKAAAPPKAA